MATNHPILTDETYRSEQHLTRLQLQRIADALETGREKVVYGFHIDSLNSDPAGRVTYLKDASGYTPAHMDFTNGVFNWGSWADAFFIPKPCMLRFNGEVAYYLDPNDYSKKADGTTPSDIDDPTFDGNVMMEFPLIWVKIVPDTDPRSASIYIASYPVDEGYHCWAHYNAYNNICKNIYLPCYNGTIDSNGKLRSLSGIANTAICASKTAAQERAAAKLCNPNGVDIWDIGTYSEWLLIQRLLTLISKSTNTQGVFGQGNTGSEGSTAGMVGTGTLDDKGMFYGYSTATSAVKTFGIENWWGNQWHRMLGMMLNDGVYKYKMTPNTADGSTATDYTLDAVGYLDGGASARTGGYYVDHMSYKPDGFGMPYGDIAGSASTYYCDGYNCNLTGLHLAIRGGRCSYGAGCGAFGSALSAAPGSAGWYIGAAPSCKPLA